MEPEKKSHQASPHPQEGTNRSMKQAAKEQPEHHNVALEEHTVHHDANEAWRATDRWTQIEKLHLKARSKCHFERNRHRQESTNTLYPHTVPDPQLPQLEARPLTTAACKQRDP